MTMERLTAKKLEASLFTTSKPNDNLHLCVVAINEKQAISFQHGPHSMLKKDEKITLYNVIEPTIQHEAVVQALSEAHDLIAFELVNGKFAYYPHASDSMFCGESYKQLGVNQQRMPTWKDGTVSEKYFGFWIGTSHEKRGDSGSGVFDSFGRFLGISVGKKIFTFEDRENTPIGEVADHHSDTKIISSDTISGIIGVVDSDPFVPQQKKSKIELK